MYPRDVISPPRRPGESRDPAPSAALPEALGRGFRRDDEVLLFAQCCRAAADS